MRSRKSEDAGYRAAVNDITIHLMAVAENYRFVEPAHSLESVDIRKTLQGLCSYLQDTFGHTITHAGKEPITFDAGHATALAVVVNELVTNAVKHGDGQVKVTCASSDDTPRIVFQNACKLPEGFVLGAGTGFGLSVAKTMAEVPSVRWRFR